jgi:glycosyltransferase involved in cell wall biosynthesis
MIHQFLAEADPFEQAAHHAALINHSYPFRTAYDAQAFLSPNGGTGKGLQLRNLLGPYANEFIGFSTKGKNYSHQRLVQEGLSSYQLWQQLSLPYLLYKWKIDFFLAPYNIAPLFIPKRTKLILVLHDLILMKHFHISNFRQRLNNTFRRLLIPEAVSQAHVILTVSAYTKSQIEDQFPVANVLVIPCSISSTWFIENPRTLEQRKNRIVLVTGNAPHKNTQRALEAYARYIASLRRSDTPRLSIVGISDAAGDVHEAARELLVDDLIDVEPYLTESQLQDLYRSSRAVLAPSLMEGFGIPVLEAMASGTPVLSSNATSLPEVGGRASTYFDPRNVEEMAETIKQVLFNPDKQRKMIELGLEQARKFHPDTVRRQVQAFWNDLASIQLDQVQAGRQGFK